jgi:hypothetical protein
MLIYFQIFVFCFNQLFHKLWTPFWGFKFKWIETNYLDLSQTNFIFQIGHIKKKITIHIDMKPCERNNANAKPKKKWLVAEHSYFDEKSNKWMIGVQINLSIGWVHP